MSFKQVKELRKDGKLEEAYQLAKLNLTAEMEHFSQPDLPVTESSVDRFKKEELTQKEGGTFLKPNPESLLWAKRALAWVLYDHLKLNATAAQFDTFIKYLQELADLQLPEDEKMVFDNVAWQVGKIVFDIHRQEKVDFQKVNALFDLVKTFHFTKPSEAYSFLYKAFHKDHQEWSRYLECADWWGFDNFRPEDFLKEEMPNGNPVMSIVEQAYIAYAKQLLPVKIAINRNNIDIVPENKRESARGFIEKGLPVSTTYFNKEKAVFFIKKLDDIIEKHPEYLYPPYFKAKLLLAMGTDENVLTAFLPFAKAKRNEFWVWDLLADIFPDEPQKQMACLCKALTCRTSDEFLNKVRTKLAGLLVASEKYAEARTEIEHVLTTAQAQGWNIPTKVSNWVNASWYKEAKPLQDNCKLYTSHAAEAEEILFADLPNELAVVEFVNTDKGILNFIVNKEKYGYLKYDQFLRKVEIGDCIEVRLDSHSKERFFKTLTLKKTDKQPNTDLLRSFTSILNKTEERDFGFADDVFVPPYLIKKMKISNGDKVSGKALISFNSRKKDWGWKAITIKKN